MYKHVFRYKTTIIQAHSQRFWGGHGCTLSKTRMKKADIAAGYNDIVIMSVSLVFFTKVFIRYFITFGYDSPGSAECKAFFPEQSATKIQSFWKTKVFLRIFSVFFTWYTTLWSTSWCTNGEKAYFCNVIPSKIAS